MIYTQVTININRDGTATSDRKVMLYRGDKEVEIQMSLVGNPFIIQDKTFAQFIIRRENNTPVIITDMSMLKDSKVILKITEQYIDELTEIGSYTYQIRLYDDTLTSRVTLPPIKDGLEVGEPIC